MRYIKYMLFFMALSCHFSCQIPGKHRKEISLNGTWKITKTGSLKQMPTSFDSEIPVPWLVDLASPVLDSQDTAYNSSIYWYKKTFTLEDANAGIVWLKINKAKYHTNVFVNGKWVGENTNNFTPSTFDIRGFLKAKGENELIIAVGCYNELPDTVANGFDFEKVKYIPGIYDDVKLILTDYPFIQTVQVVPDIKNRKLRVVAELLPGDKSSLDVSYSVSEHATGRELVSGKILRDKIASKGAQKLDFSIGLNNFQLWTPENPFLYDLKLTTSGDNSRTRFGMRSFEVSKDSGVFLLNGKPYYMRGTNVCIYRFFEDPSRKELPWDSEWITKLHNRFKEMHWNSIRYCIGFPPERWYEIADSIGFLIQDEFPIWTLGDGRLETLRKLTPEHLAQEYRQWMRERWNHPCVVIWDAQNESVTDLTGKAIELVRDLDLSNRPWDNGWGVPVSRNDAIEAHPYLFIRYREKVPSKEGYLKELMGQPQVPKYDPNSQNPSPDGKRYTNPAIINEYGWLWLNRDGSPTTISEEVYSNVFPEAKTPEKRFEIYAKSLGILTEYWRAHRKAGAVLHFCGLGYSRPEEPRGQTSDHFIDIGNLTYEPHFYNYVKMAFSPVGLMLDFWENTASPGQKFTIPIRITNDTYEDHENTVHLSLFRDNNLVDTQSARFKVQKIQKSIVELPIIIPKQTGNYRLEAEMNYKGEPVKSSREFVVKQ